MESTKCPSCNEFAVQELEVSKKVCTECGLLVEDGWTMAYDTEGTSVVKDERNRYESSLPTAYLRLNKPDHESKAKKKYERVIDRLTESFTLSQELCGEAKKLFNTFWPTDAFRHVLVEKKKIVAGCCLFIVCRTHDLPMLMRFFCDALGCTKEDFSRETRRVVKMTGIKVPSQDISDYVESYCRSLKVSERVECITFDIIEVAKNTWISQGRQTDLVLAAAVYFAWVAEEPLQRLKVSMAKFFKQQSTPYSNLRAARVRLHELIAVVCRLSKEIPWVDVEKEDFRTAVHNLEDVTKYQQTLMREAALNWNLESHSSSTGSPSKPEDGDKHSEVLFEQAASVSQSEHLIPSLAKTQRDSVDTSTNLLHSDSSTSRNVDLVQPRQQHFDRCKEVEQTELEKCTFSVSDTNCKFIEKKKTNGSTMVGADHSTHEGERTKRKRVTSGTLHVTEDLDEALSPPRKTPKVIDACDSCFVKKELGTVKQCETASVFARDNLSAGYQPNSVCDTKYVVPNGKCSRSGRKAIWVEHSVQPGNFLPSSFVVGRQKSREAVKVVKESDDVKDNSLEVSIEEIDKDIEQYIRTEQEIEFIKDLHKKTCQ